MGQRLLVSILLSLLASVAIAGGAGSSPGPIHRNRTLTLDQRITAQWAIERARWEHRIWPKENPSPKPAIESLLSPALVQERVEDGLRKQRALEVLSGVRISRQDLQGEIDRMARASKDLSRLAELWAALGNDPTRVGECLARPQIVERRLRDQYDALESNRVPANLERRDALPSPSLLVGADTDAVSGTHSSTVAIPFDVWWQSARSTFELVLPEPVEGLSLPSITPHSTCVQGALSRMDPDMPTPRVGHTAVWTGSELIIWGGMEGDYLNEGWKYDPVADVWTPINSTGAPAGRMSHLAVWTGTRMLVSGGEQGSVFAPPGGRYDPALDSWSPMSADGDPALSSSEITAVWTGSQWIQWGTSNGQGARYSPANDIWTPMTATNAPSGRSGHSAVWTGNRMVVWGGYTYDDNGDPVNLNTGGSYDPVADSWRATKISGAPSGRAYHTAIWDGSRMLVWGGEVEEPTGCNPSLSDGKKYDPAHDRWESLSAIGAPSARFMHAAVWTGTRMLVWGGRSRNPDCGSSDLASGGSYDPVQNAWLTISSTGAPSARFGAATTWAGGRMIVWGGANSSYLDSGGRYDPAADTWSPTFKTSHRPTLGNDHSAVWTGAEMIVIGGVSASAALGLEAFRYDPVTDDWTTIPPTPLGSSPRYRATAVWTGQEVLIFGGVTRSSAGEVAEIAEGLGFNPASGTWFPLSQAGEPAARVGHSVVWTGDGMIVWGGGRQSDGYYTTLFGDGAIYHPGTGSWSPTSVVQAPSSRAEHSTVWTGREMTVWGGRGFLTQTFQTGARYVPATDTWSATNDSGAPTPRFGHVGVWDGSSMVVWGGSWLAIEGARYDAYLDTWRPMNAAGSPPSSNDVSAGIVCDRTVLWPPPQPGGAMAPAALYDSITDSWTTSSPVVPRRHFPLVSTGNQVIVFGGEGYASTSNTGFLYCACGAQPLPGSTTLFVDKLVPGQARVSWYAAPDAIGYDVVRGSVALLHASVGDFSLATEACVTPAGARTWLEDPGPGDPGGTWYLVRARRVGGVGSYDEGSASQVGSRDAEIAASGAGCP